MIDGVRRAKYTFTETQGGCIAAALSGDPALLKAYRSGDVHLSFAKQAELAPSKATKASHGGVRERCKAVVLGTLYGMGEETLARRIGRPSCEARELLRLYRATYPRFWRWPERYGDKRGEVMWATVMHLVSVTGKDPIVLGGTH